MKKLYKLIPFFAVFIFISYNLVWVYTKNLIENEPIDVVTKERVQPYDPDKPAPKESKQSKWENKWLQKNITPIMVSI